jgi:CDGSH-type Zn-finger protein
LTLRGVGPESVVESVRFHGRRVTRVGPGVKYGVFGLRGRDRKFSIADSEQVLPLAKFALEAHALGNPDGRDDTPLDLLTAFPPGPIILSFRKSFPRLFTGCIRIALEVFNGPSYNSSSMRRVVKIANKPLEIKPQEKSVWICMCGLSKNQPYCDGSHKEVADEQDGRT